MLIYKNLPAIKVNCLLLAVFIGIKLGLKQL